MEAQQLSEHVFSLPFRPPFFIGYLAPNVYLVRDGDEGALVDSGFSDDDSVNQRLAWLRGANVRIRYILLTHHHFDHASGAHRLAEALGAQVVLHAQEQPFLEAWREEVPQDMDIPAGQEEVRQRIQRFRYDAAQAARDPLWVQDETELKIGRLVLHICYTPGHTMGSICIWMPQEGILFTGDTALGLGTVAVSPPPYGDMGLYLRSLERLKNLGPQILLPGHGPPVKDAIRKIQELIDHRREREEQILGLLAQGKDTVTSLVQAIYPELDGRILPMAHRQVSAHLHKLMQEGQVLLIEAEEPRYVLA